MRSSLAEVLAIAPEQVGVKATTNEKMGPTGRQEGIAVLRRGVIDQFSSIEPPALAAIPDLC